MLSHGVVRGCQAHGRPGARVCLPTAAGCTFVPVARRRPRSSKDTASSGGPTPRPFWSHPHQIPRLRRSSPPAVFRDGEQIGRTTTQRTTIPEVFVMVCPLPCCGVLIRSKCRLIKPSRRYRLPGGLISRPFVQKASGERLGDSTHKVPGNPREAVTY